MKIGGKHRGGHMHAVSAFPNKNRRMFIETFADWISLNSNRGSRGRKNVRPRAPNTHISHSKSIAPGTKLVPVHIDHVEAKGWQRAIDYAANGGHEIWPAECTPSAEQVQKTRAWHDIMILAQSGELEEIIQRFPKEFFAKMMQI
jgi:hypothetical protein